MTETYFAALKTVPFAHSTAIFVVHGSDVGDIAHRAWKCRPDVLAEL